MDYPEVSPREIAWWAEAAHGLADADKAVLVRTDDGVKVMLERDVGTGQKILVRVMQKPDNRTKPTSILIETEGGEHDLLAEGLDCLFWTQSSMEKFLLPYYVSQRLLDEPELNALKAAVKDRTIVAIGHIPPSEAVNIPERAIGLLVQGEEDVGSQAVSLITLEDYSKDLEAP